MQGPESFSNFPFGRGIELDDFGGIGDEPGYEFTFSGGGNVVPLGPIAGAGDMDEPLSLEFSHIVVDHGTAQVDHSPHLVLADFGRTMNGQQYGQAPEILCGCKEH